GYIVEVKIPLANFRFNAGENAEMYVLFWRRINRMGISGSWPEIIPGESILGSGAKVVYGNLNKQLMLEFIPSITYSVGWDRETPDKWSDPDDNTEVGITGKYGVTSTVTAEFTVNPDYSQVESDAFSVLVNQRYPTFYSEKRPFFMEAGNLFDLAGTNRGDTNMIRVVHTRTIVDPAYGFRLSGEVGNLAFALLTTGDEAPGRAIIDDEPNPFADKLAYFTSGRVKYNIGKSNYIGAIFTNNDFAEGYNQVFGADFKYRLNGNIFQGYFIQSLNKDKVTLEETDGAAYSLQWDYSSRALGMCVWWEHLDTDFQMDSAFYSRSKMDKVTAYFGPSFFPEGEGWSWIHSINPFLWGQYTHDLETGEDDYFVIAVLRMFFIKDAWIRFDYRAFSEYWAGKQLEGSYLHTQGEIQLTKWLNLYTYFRIGEGPYYDDVYPQVGDRVQLYLDCTIQPSGNFTQYFNYTYSKLDSQEDDSTLYDINILRSKTTYQFNDKLYLRAYIQYDDYRKIVLGDMLLSYQLVPGTVLHLGYGSYHEKLDWQNGSWQDGTNEIGDYYQTSQSIFFKASYLVKF
ncbi:MAG: hypothetical protein JW737_00790, partial [Acidobacteria bacterium]|nr:hypothetical protein [Acidobacteriota bacterium]